MNQQLNLFPEPPKAPVLPAGPPRTLEGNTWTHHAGPMSVTLNIPAADLAWLREVIANHLASAAKLRAGWGLPFMPNLVVEAGEPDAAGQVAATIRATHFEGWSPTPEGAAWWFRHTSRKEPADG